MTDLFEATQIKDLRVQNRFIRSATSEGMAGNNGACSVELVKLMVELVQGGVGLIITGHAFVSADGQRSRGQLGVHQDRLVENLREMTEAVHHRNGRIVLQLNHAGLRADPAIISQRPKGPSNCRWVPEAPGHEMNPDDIHEIVESFGQAGRRAKEAGFDGVQIHAAHGYLLSQFLSPAFNRRTDAYGGSLENRARILIEVLGGVRQAVGLHYPILVKINSDDFLDQGLTLSDFLQVGVMLDLAGVDAIEISGGTHFSGERIPFRKNVREEGDQAYYCGAAKSLKVKIAAPVMLVGGIRSFTTVEGLVTDGVTDYISMCRPFIREPGLVARWKSGDLRPAACVSCNGCLAVLLSGKGLYCVQERKNQEL